MIIELFVVVVKLGKAMSLFEWVSGKSSIFFKNRAKEFASFVHKLGK